MFVLLVFQGMQLLQAWVYRAFMLKCLAMVICDHMPSTYVCSFDTAELLNKIQSNYHGLPLSSPSLLQELAPLILFQALQEGILRLAETSVSVPNAIILWTMGSAKFCFLSNLIWQANLSMAFTGSGGGIFLHWMPTCIHLSITPHSEKAVYSLSIVT